MLEAEFVRDIDQATVNDGMSSLEGVTSVEIINSRSLRFKFSGDAGGQARLLARLAAMDLGLVSFKPSTSLLEDTYLNLIKDTM